MNVEKKNDIDLANILIVFSWFMLLSKNVIYIKK